MGTTKSKRHPTLHEALAMHGLRRAEKTRGVYAYAIRTVDTDRLVFDGNASDVWSFLKSKTEAA